MHMFIKMMASKTIVEVVNEVNRLLKNGDNFFDRGLF